MAVVVAGLLALGPVLLGPTAICKGATQQGAVQQGALQQESVVEGGSQHEDTQSASPASPKSETAPREAAHSKDALRASFSGSDLEGIPLPLLQCLFTPPERTGPTEALVRSARLVIEDLEGLTPSLKVTTLLVVASLRRPPVSDGAPHAAVSSGFSFVSSSQGSPGNLRSVVLRL